MRPEYLKQGEEARLFPVLANTSKEGRTTSIVLACLSKIDEYGEAVLSSVGRKLGKRSKISTYTEIVLKNEKVQLRERPDGLIVVTSGSNNWRALVEAKVGNNDIDAEQVDRYRALAKENDLDCVITISNQFASNPANHPVSEVRSAKSKIPVFHWSWMYLLTTAHILISNDEVADQDQAILLSELRRFLTHESSGIKGFVRMPSEWTELNRLVSAGGSIPAKSEEARIVLEAWHQESRDLALLLSQKTETQVGEKLVRKHLSDPALRIKDDLVLLREKHQLQGEFDVPDAAALINVVADLQRRTVEIGMFIRAPDDRKSSKARLNWLLRQVKTEKTADIHIRMMWPGRSEATQYPLDELQVDPDLINQGKDGLQVTGFHVCQIKRLGSRFIQQENFIKDLEAMVPDFYYEVGQSLTVWQKPAPKIKASPETIDVFEPEQEDAAAKPKMRSLLSG